MDAQSQTPEAFIAELPAERQKAMHKLRLLFQTHLPAGFEERMHNGMLSYEVPHRLYPAGYQTNPKEPLPFIAVAATKNNIAIHHVGLYASSELSDWYDAAYSAQSNTKMDRGKGCLRFKKEALIPYELLEELAGKMTVADWIQCYEANIKK